MTTRIKRLIGALSIGVLAVSLTACGGAPAASEAKTVDLKLGHVFPESDPQAKAISRFADEVKTLTDGSVSITVYPAGQLGGDREILESLELGATDMWYGGAGAYNSMSDVGQFFVTPFMFDSVDDAMEAYNGELGEAVRKRLDDDTATTVVGIWARGPRHVTSNEPVKTPADMEGMRIRVPENPMFIEGFKAFGANPTPMAFPEVYTALQQGTIDAQENPLALIKSSGFPTVQKYLNLTGHVIEPLAISISDESWNALTDDQQNAITQAAEDIGKEFQEEVNADEAQLTKDLEAEGMTIIKPDIAAFRDAAQSVRETTGQAFSDLYALVDAR